MIQKTIRELTDGVKSTPLHPQWFIFRNSNKDFKIIGQKTKGLILDIGSGRQLVRSYLPRDSQYLPLDYLDTAVNWYKHLPDVFADAQILPFAQESFDTILLLDVLEHLPFPQACIREIKRVLKPNGQAIIRVPFLYPLHDAPLDFNRWTKYGLEKLVQQNGFTIKEIKGTGQPMETAVLLFNIALAKIGINWIAKKNPLLLLVILFPPIILISNLIGWLMTRLSPSDPFMPQSYQILLQNEKQQSISNP